jgi:hypothetical protein
MKKTNLTFKILILFILFISNISFASTKQDTLFQAKDVILELWNPGLLTTQHLVIGSFYVFDNSLFYNTYSTDAIEDKKLYRYNSLIKDFSISFTELEKIKTGFLISFKYTTLIVKLKDGVKYKFIMSKKNKKKVKELVGSKLE